MIGVAMAMRIASLLHLHKIKTPQESSSAIASVGFVEALKTCMKAPGLVLFIVFSAWMNFWMGFTGPFVPVFCFEELKVHTAEFTMLVTLGTLTGIAGWVFWGKTADRVGSVAVIIVGTILWELQQFLWVVLTPETAWLLYPMYLWGGFFAVSFFMGCFNLLLNLAPEKSSLAAVSLNLAVTSVAAALAPMLAGGLLEEFVTKRGGGLGTYHLGFLIKSVAFLLGLGLLLMVHEPTRSTRSSLPGAFRSMRQLLAAQGLEFLSNLVPFRNSQQPPNKGSK
jgi:MFS family permease